MFWRILFCFFPGHFLGIILLIFLFFFNSLTGRIVPTLSHKIYIRQFLPSWSFSVSLVAGSYRSYRQVLGLLRRLSPRNSSISACFLFFHFLIYFSISPSCVLEGKVFHADSVPISTTRFHSYVSVSTFCFDWLNSFLSNVINSSTTVLNFF